MVTRCYSIGLTQLLSNGLPGGLRYTDLRTQNVWTTQEMMNFDELVVAGVEHIDV